MIDRQKIRTNECRKVITLTKKVSRTTSKNHNLELTYLVGLELIQVLKATCRVAKKSQECVGFENITRLRLVLK